VIPGPVEYVALPAAAGDDIVIPAWLAREPAWHRSAFRPPTPAGVFQVPSGVPGA